MKKILIITYDSPNIDRRIYLISDSLEKSGYDVNILTPYANVEEGYEHIKVINLIEKNPFNTVSSPVFIKDILRKYLPNKLFNFIKSLYRSLFTSDGYIPYLEEMKNKATSIKADIYVAVDLITLPIVESCIDKNGGSFVYDAHEFFLGQKILTEKQKECLGKLETDIFPKVDLLITVNEDIRNLFFERYGQVESEIILNATKDCLNEKKYLHDLIGVSRDVPLILYQGGFIGNRKLENLVNMATHLENSLLVMLGWGDLESKLRKLASDLNVLNKKVFFIPKISQKELISYTSSAKIGIIPYEPCDLNTKFCTPNKLFEFICAGIPIAYNSKLVTVDRIIKQYSIGIQIDINDPKGSAQILDNLLVQSKLYNSLEVNVSKANQVVNWENEEKKLLHVFRNLKPKNNSITPQ
ncbi:glycosyltransferase [Taylorella equigenitalis]|uniref:Glycosyl transferase, group 1 n=3 Tax=Taylorella equigenitalis TaxID=29575 RepID=A0A654KHN2_TAYEM|nr:glycosyltransferase [Taylorella equigenitalis]ADU91941.1 glycosyl transferase, group 1 [Taylorella equigenitalis MCE9]AFN35504.1 glycosyl transferase, group 1 [Taylorella equigenitalis ATCC 35865]ASY30155.1 glycosyl transferase family 1 [Taylorella equigenitalis]ASY37463.1 glycosyl transferase family 1 [Taylorella equigenitalis]ASY38932.1 glycosyl transferase family 1 [Taylorella equigenitalis]